MTLPWRTLARSVRYGYTPHYWLELEGIPTLLCEYIGDAIAPEGYSMDASLVIDRSARIGPVIDEAKHTSKGFDLEARFLPTTATDAIFGRRPTRVSALTASCGYLATTLSASTIGWPSSGTLYMGTSCGTYASTSREQFKTVSRPYGALRNYPRGTLVTDAPHEWQGRKARLFMVMLDPAGFYVQGADIFEKACVVWEGEVGDQLPYRDGTEWVLWCPDQVRKMQKPLGVAASGQAVWELDDDQELAAFQVESAVFSVHVEDGNGDVDKVQISPFLGMTGYLRRSRIRQILAEAIDAACVSAEVGKPFWVPESVPSSGGMKRSYRMYLPYSTTALVGVGVKISIDGPYASIFVLDADTSATDLRFSNQDTLINLRTPLSLPAFVFRAGLKVRVDDAAASDLPASGWLQLVGNGETQYRRYTGLAVDTVDAQRVTLHMDAATTPTDNDIAAIAGNQIEGDIAPMSVTFLWADQGPIEDVLRRAITSSGTGQNGVYDTLAERQGLDLANIDSDSFDRVFSGAFRLIRPQIAVEAGTSLEDTWSGLLKLSGRGLSARRAADGSAMQIAAVQLGSADAGVPVATITESMLAARRGRRSVRTKSVFAAPRIIKASCRTVAIADMPPLETPLIFNNKGRKAGEAWKLDVFGLDAEQLRLPGEAWATSWFRSGNNRQISELDVGPDVDAQPGDIVYLDLPNPALWDYASGYAGYVGFARVLGAPFELGTGVQTLTVAIDGIMSAGPLCPSIPIITVNGTATSPTSIDVPAAWYDLLVRAKNGQASWKLKCYRPGFDSGRHDYTFGAITLPGHCRLAVTSSPSSPTLTLTTSHRLTYPDTSQCTTTQRVHLHTDHVAQWS